MSLFDKKETLNAVNGASKLLVSAMNMPFYASFGHLEVNVPDQNRFVDSKNYENKADEGETEFKANAGHGGLKLITIGDKKYIKKKTNRTEAIAYLENYEAIKEGIFADIGQIEIHIDEKKITRYSKEDIESYQTKRDEIIEALKNTQTNNITIAIEKLEAVSTSNDKDTKEFLDVKIGSRTYDDKEADVNGNKHKHIFNKIQMSFGEMMSRLGGAKRYQISDSSNLVLRQFKYVNSQDKLMTYFSKFNNEDLLKLEDKLLSIKKYIHDSKFKAVGASLLYHGNDVHLIDPAHYIPKGSKTGFDKFNYLNTDLVKSIDEQVELIRIEMSKKALSNSNKGVDKSNPDFIFNATKYKQLSKVDQLLQKGI